MVADVAQIEFSLVYDGTQWQLFANIGPAGAAGATGSAAAAGASGVIWENGSTITSSYSLTSSKNGLTVGPVTISAGAAITIPANQRWLVL